MSETRRSQIVRNRDIPKLSRVLWMMQDVSATEQKRKWMQDRLWHITQVITGMPGGGGQPRGLDDGFAALSVIEEVYEREIVKLTAQLKEAEKILNGIESPCMRTFVTMRYVLDMSRKEIMEKLNLKRWRYDEICEGIENAADMAHVNWRERYMIQ